MSFLIALAFVIVLWVCISLCLLQIIVKYIKKKPPGLQSILDCLILELIQWHRLQISVLVVTYFSGILYGQLDPWTAKALNAVMTNVTILVHAYVQVILFVKAILIFKQGWLEDILEDEVLLLSRIASVAYAALTFVIDYSNACSTRVTSRIFDRQTSFIVRLIKFIFYFDCTFHNYFRPFNPGPFVGVMLVILLATFIVLKIKTPDLPVLSGEEKRNHNRFTLVGITFCSVV